VGGGLQDHANMIRPPGPQLGPHATHAGSREQAAQQGEVHPAHQRPALVGEGVERAIAEPYLAVDAGRIVSAFIEHGERVGEQAIRSSILPLRPRAAAPSVRPSAPAARASAPRAAGAMAVNARANTRPASS